MVRCSWIEKGCDRRWSLGVRPSRKAVMDGATAAGAAEEMIKLVWARVNSN